MYNPNDIQSGNDLIQQYAPLVKRIAHHLLARLPASVLVDDLIQAGMIGLLEAARKYDCTKGASFETYAGIRIRGSIIDEVRKGDWTPRSVHRNGRRISEAIQSIEAKTGGDAPDVAIAQEMGITVDEYHKLLKDNVESKLFSIDELTSEQENGPSEQLVGDDLGPMEITQKSAFVESLVQAMQTLPEREQLVMALYYDEELNLKEIGQILEVSESRVSQIHSQAAHRLKSRLKQWQ